MNHNTKTLKIGFPTWIGVAIQLVLTHLVTGFVTLLTASRGVSFMVAIMLGLIVGLALTFSLQRTLWLLDTLLSGKRELVSNRWHGPLNAFARRVQELAANSQAVSTLRDNLIGQVQETAAQQERNRLARELHDSIKQQLFSISMSAAAAETRFEGDALGARKAIADIRQSTGEAMVEMTALLQQLAPAPLEKVGLQQALRDQCEALGYRTGAAVTIRFGTLPSDERLPFGTQTSLFRIVQEALSNIARHARATHVDLVLGLNDTANALELSVTDDGQGFDPSSAETGMGLANMRGRVYAMGGTFELHSANGQGSSLQIVIPLLETLEEKIMVISPNSTFTRILGTGIVGGLLLIAALFYPLFGVLPGNFIPDWSSSSPVISLLCQILGFGVILATGYFAARAGKAASRSGGILFGAIAGGIAGLVLFAGLGAAASALVSNNGLIQHGMGPAANENEAMALLTNAVVWTLWGVSGSIVVVLLGGIGLGALGSLVYTPPVDAKPVAWHNLRASLKLSLISMTLLGSIAVLGIAATYSLLEAAVRNNITQTQTNISPLLVLGIGVLPLGAALLCQLIPFTGIVLLLRRERISNPLYSLWFAQPIGMTILLGLFALPSPLLLIIQTHSISSNIILIIGSVCSVSLGLLCGRLCLQVRHQQQVAGLVSPLTVGSIFRSLLKVFGLLLAVGAALYLVQLALISSFQNALLIAIPVIGLVMILIIVVIIILKPNLKILQSSASSRMNEQPSELQAHINGLVPSWVGIILVFIVGSSSSLALVFLPVVLIPNLFAYDHSLQDFQASLTIRSVVENLYLGYAQAFFYAAVIAGIVLGIITLILWALAQRSAYLTVKVLLR